MCNPFSLKNKTIFITGASSGIGRSTAIECSKMGARVIISGRNKERLNETFSKLEGEEHTQLIVDLSKHEEIENLINDLPLIDGCVNNAGLTKTLLTQFITFELIDEVLKVNTIAPILITQKLVKKKKLNKNASIVFTSSISGVYSCGLGGGMYSTSKGAINGFAKNAALDLASKNIRVNCVCPGMINTQIFKDGIITKEQLDQDMKKYPLKRYGEPEEVAYAIIYLLSDASAWVTGSNLLIDGGLTLQ